MQGYLLVSLVTVLLFCRQLYWSSVKSQAVGAMARLSTAADENCGKLVAVQLFSEPDNCRSVIARIVLFPAVAAVHDFLNGAHANRHVAAGRCRAS
ncbi:hypothetical protein PSEUDO8AS_10423 [Pseudomonas sp. 8AS]|nr:hypothetical protein PSEUDO8AS_10423 [Pseudomonas sp. 8AS]